ncbi:MAG: NAD/NADP octopine/nopaline dehydrogenase family protein [Gemmatimonadetes bacterium]|nr:NAD/NADP octopine/nopaline dehydrogenase family protein [Gemmatimonadota bacterium]
MVPAEQPHTIAVLGAGNGGKAVAADVALQGAAARLFEWPEYAANIEALIASPVIEAEGVVAGTAELQCATTDLAEAIEGADLIIACVQGLAHERLAWELASALPAGATVLLNPGSTGGALEFRRVFAERGGRQPAALAETGTLTHCARAVGERGVRVTLRVGHVAFAALPATHTDGLLARLQRRLPGLRRRADVLEVALCNGNPAIHPAIMLANLGAIERAAGAHRFYAEGVTPGVGRIVEAVDRERLAIGVALGYELMTEPEMCVAQGYGTSTDYYECYARSPVFGDLLSPTSADHRYLHEDVGLGLVTYVSLGEMLGVECPRTRGLVELASAVTGIDYLREGRRSAARLGLAGLSTEERHRFLQGDAAG